MRPDPLSPARGILIGLVLCIPIWFVIVAFADGIHQSRVIAERGQETDLGVSYRTANGGRP